MHIIIFQFDGMKLGKLLGWLDSLRIALCLSHYKAYMNQGYLRWGEYPPPLTEAKFYLPCICDYELCFCDRAD